MCLSFSKSKCIIIIMIQCVIMLNEVMSQAGRPICFCVQATQCYPYVNSMHNNPNIFDQIKVMQFWRSKFCGYINGLPKVCCEHLPPHILNSRSSRLISSLKANETSRTVAEDIKPAEDSTAKNCTVGYCIGVYDCPYFAELIERELNSRKLEVINIIKRDMCGLYQTSEGQKAPKVCCMVEPKADRRIISTTVNVPVITTTTTELPFKMNSEIKSNDQGIEAHPNFKLLPMDTCGTITTGSRITVGESAAIGEFPWMAILFYESDDLIDFRCAGTLINKRYVLTAAHCIDDSIIGVRLGELNLMTTKDCTKRYCAPPALDLLVENIVVHPQFVEKLFLNDIALVRLTVDVDFNGETISPICLPLRDVNITGQLVTVSGWGVTEFGVRSAELRKTLIPVNPIGHCRSIYQRFMPITDNQICAGGLSGRDSCSGDSGGPLKKPETIRGVQRYVQYGIVSYGPRVCGTINQPGIYTKVFSYVPWILDTIRP